MALEPPAETFDVLVLKAWNYVAEEFDEVVPEEFLFVLTAWVAHTIITYELKTTPEDISQMLAEALEDFEEAYEDDEDDD